MIDLCKYITGTYDTGRPNFKLVSDSNTRGHSKKLVKNRSRLVVRINFFTKGVVSVWNNLPEAVVNAPSVNAFKNRLDANWANHPALYEPECYNQRSRASKMENETGSVNCLVNTGLNHQQDQVSSIN